MSPERLKAISDAVSAGTWNGKEPEPAPVAKVAPVREVVAEIIPFAQPATKCVLDDDAGTLRRLELAEKTAYQHYITSGGSERAAIAWLGICDQKRKLVADTAKQQNDVTESETKFMANCAEVIDTLHFHLQTAPKLLGLLCEGLERDIIEAKIADQLRRTIQYAVGELADLIRGTSLERLLPAHERGRKNVRPDEVED